MLGLWFAQQIFLSMLTSGATGPGAEVAYLAHAGGFAFGLVAAIGMKAYRVEERWISGAIEAKANPVLVKNEAVDAALEAASAGNAAGAWDLLTRELRRAPANVDAAVALWSVAQDLGRQKEAAPAFSRAIEHEIRAGNVDTALSHWDELRAAVPTATVDARTLLRIASELGRRGDRKEAVDALRRALLAGAASTNPAILLRIAETAAGIDPALARAAAAAALGRPDLDEAGRAKARALAGG